MNSEENYAGIQNFRKWKYLSIQIKKLLAAVHLTPIPATLPLEGCSLRENKMTHWFID